MSLTFRTVVLAAVLAAGLFFSGAWLVDRFVRDLPWLPEDLRRLSGIQTIVLVVLPAALAGIYREAERRRVAKGFLFGRIRAQYLSCSLVKSSRPHHPSARLRLETKNRGVFDGRSLVERCGGQDLMQAFLKDFSAARALGLPLVRLTDPASYQAANRFCESWSSEWDRAPGEYERAVFVFVADPAVAGARQVTNRLLVIWEANLALLRNPVIWPLLGTMKASRSQRADLIRLITIAHMLTDPNGAPSLDAEGGFAFTTRLVPNRRYPGEINARAAMKALRTIPQTERALTPEQALRTIVSISPDEGLDEADPRCAPVAPGDSDSEEAQTFVREVRTAIAAVQQYPHPRRL